MQREAEVRDGKAVGSGLSTKFTPMSDKPPVGIRPQWLVLEERQAEICDAMKRYDERALLPPDEWLLELKEIENQLAELLPERAPQPRRFFSIRRTILRDGDHIIDAVDYEGNAWWMRLDTQPHHPAFPPQDPAWQQLSPLPARKVGHEWADAELRRRGVVG